ncbi:MAG: hypothetical protein Kow0090_08830 [Myxococcota bacterium]
MAKKGKSSASSFTALENGYFDNQSAGGKGGSASAYLLKHLQRKANLLFNLLWNQDPNETKYNKPTGGGHSHDGTDSVFIGNTVSAQVRHPFETGEAFDITDIVNGWGVKNRWSKPIMYKSGTGNFSYNLPTLDRLYFGRGANRARMWILWTGVAVYNGNWRPVGIDTIADVVFRLRCENTAQQVDKTIRASQTAPYIEWSEVTEVTGLEVEPAASNQLNLSVQNNPYGESMKIIIFGYVIREAQA